MYSTTMHVTMMHSKTMYLAKDIKVKYGVKIIQSNLNWYKLIIEDPQDIHKCHTSSNSCTQFKNPWPYSFFKIVTQSSSNYKVISLPFCNPFRSTGGGQHATSLHTYQMVVHIYRLCKQTPQSNYTSISNHQHLKQKLH